MAAARPVVQWNDLLGVRDFLVKNMLPDVESAYRASNSNRLAAMMVMAGVTFSAIVFVRLLTWRSSSSSSSSSSPSCSSSSSSSACGRSLGSMPGPPSPWYNIMGNTLELSAHPDKPYPLVFMDWVREYGGVFKFRLIGTTMVAVSDPDLVKQLCLRSFITFHDRSERFLLNFDPNGFFVSRGNYWKSVRAAAQPMFTAAHLRAFAGIMQQTSSVLLKKLKAVSPGQTVEISSWFHALAMDTVGEAALGIRFSTQERSSGPAKALVDAIIADLRSYDLHEGIDLIDILTFFAVDMRLVRCLAALSARIPGTKRYKLRKNIECIKRECWKIVESRRETCSSINSTGSEVEGEARTGKGQATSELIGNFLAFMTKAKVDDPANEGRTKGLTNCEMSGLVRDILVGGSDTSAATLTYAVYLLDANPRVKEKLTAEIDDWYRKQESSDLQGKLNLKLNAVTEPIPDLNDLVQLPYLHQVVQEVLRIFPVVPALGRKASDDYQLGEWLIPKGTYVVIPICGMHRCPKNFANPDEFRPERFDPSSSEEHRSRHPYAFMPFGLGPRMCLGKNFAMLELKSVLFKLYRHLDMRVVKESLSFDENGSPQWHAGITTHIKGGLTVTVNPRKDSEEGGV